ncbi:unnamed protein product [Amoebophrya sp. A25]|nr:unnamed protein product [Amoebophrya sp. A25]|eukprot:GSA25T00013700001.1
MVSPWSEVCYYSMVEPDEATATWTGNAKNVCMCAAIGGKDFSMGLTAPPSAEAGWWGCAGITQDQRQAGAGEAEGIQTDAAWEMVWSEDQNRDIMQDDGSEVPTPICEFQTVLSALAHDNSKGPLPNGVWIGGVKHTVTRKEKEEGPEKDLNFMLMNAARKGKKGFAIICTDYDLAGKAGIVIAGYSENENVPFSMAAAVALEAAKWMTYDGLDKSEGIYY